MERICHETQTFKQKKKDAPRMTLLSEDYFIWKRLNQKKILLFLGIPVTEQKKIKKARKKTNSLFIYSKDEKDNCFLGLHKPNKIVWFWGLSIDRIDWIRGEKNWTKKKNYNNLYLSLPQATKVVQFNCKSSGWEKKILKKVMFSSRSPNTG